MLLVSRRGLMMVSYSTGSNSRAGLSSAPVVGTFGPGHDRDAQFLASAPAAPVEDIVLQ